MKAKALAFVSVAVACCLSSEAAQQWPERKPPDKNLASSRSAGRDASAVEALGMVETDWLAQAEKQPFDDQATRLSDRSRLRVERLESLPPVVFLKNTEFGNSPRLEMSISDGPYNGKPFKAGAAIMMFTATKDGAGRVETLLDDPNGMIRDLDVSYDGKRVLFSWKKNQYNDDYHIYEMTVATKKVRLITKEEGVADIQARYLTDGRILYHSTRCVNVVDCNEKIDVVNLYSCDLDGQEIVRLTFDQVSTQFPSLLQDGRIIYTRWEYNDRGQIFPQGLFTMNSDGTQQAAFYGNSSWYPTSLIQARSIPGTSDLLAIASGHHTPPCGKLAIISVAQGREEGHGIGLLAPERSAAYARIDAAEQDDILFQYPYPLSDNSFLVGASLLGKKKSQHFGIYWVNRKGERELLAWDERESLRHPLPLAKRDQPVLRTSVTSPTFKHGRFYVKNVYLGEGLKGIPEGTIKKLRVIALEFRPAAVGTNYNEGEGGRARVCTPISITGAWDIKKVLGDATVYRDGSALFDVPARTPVYFQALDANGHAVQTMRSWATLQPGETFSCVGCHEDKNSAPATAGPLSLAMKAGPQQLTPFHVPAQGFSFLKDVQPILNKKCIRCHKLDVWQPNCEPSDDGNAFSLLARPVHEAKSGRIWTESYLGLLQATMPKDNKRDTYHAKSNSFINWISPQSGPEVLVPYSFGAAKSPMLAMLKEGHGDTRLTAEEFETLACWIDLAVPFCGDYTEANRWSEKEKNWYARQIEKQRKLFALEKRD